MKLPMSFHLFRLLTGMPCGLSTFDRGPALGKGDITIPAAKAPQLSTNRHVPTVGGRVIHRGQRTGRESAEISLIHRRRIGSEEGGIEMDGQKLKNANTVLVHG